MTQKTTRTIDFFFDFSSAYSYVALGKLDAFEAARDVSFVWRPFSLGVVFKETGGSPAKSDSLKGRYITRDVERSAGEIGLPYVWPQPFPFNSIPAARAFYAIAETDPRMAQLFARAVFAASYGLGKDLSDADQILGVVAELGLDREDMAGRMGGDQARAKLKAVTDEALRLGIFGAPMFLAEGELFWGADRLDQLGHWLDRGGW
ncbi:2-hydroxychromene-2-carboxylate isomerase [Govanella unica]|uniref:2-hydroxychromene-2-carboxylate isomerase n=1 Tax=Govanella unica TaxID=2975056 RepID=A0A9X3U052_9PROT|nr:2-hydroxychromene-2-carboxylate isomerase [Govania unica]MDA5194768.1 2-hydroxychromene-2-carboxylate isomerase [Govania unica]